jgi:hypothetical protein
MSLPSLPRTEFPPHPDPHTPNPDAQDLHAPDSHGPDSHGSDSHAHDLARPVSAALRARYADPARAQAVPAGPLFDVVSVAMDVGLETLDLMLRSGEPLGPVAADGRTQVRRVGFLLPPGTLARLAGFAWWCRSHDMRIATHGDVVALPPLIGDAQSRFQWLVPPDAVPGTDPALLLNCLRRALGRRRHPGRCQVSAG